MEQMGKPVTQGNMGRKCKQEAVPFGGKGMYKKLTESGARKQVMECQREEGIWLGHNRGSNESLIGTPNGVMKAWAVRRRVPEERWSNDHTKISFRQNLKWLQQKRKRMKYYARKRESACMMRLTEHACKNK